MSNPKTRIFLTLGLGFIYALFLHHKLGMDASWDTKHYHLFIGWAALHLSSYDFGSVAQWHTYLNPLADVLNYITFSIHPYIGALYHAVVFAITLLIVYFIAEKVISFHSDNKLFVVSSVVMGATGAMTVSLFGSFTNEHITAIFILASLFLVINNIDKGNGIVFLIAGILVGFAMGLKLTAASYVIGILAVIIICTKANLKSITFICAGVVLGYLFSDGLFMFMRWESVGNPFFPFANNIFKSTYLPARGNFFSFFDTFGLSKVPYYLSLPFIWLSASDFSEAKEIRDGRMLLAYIGFALVFLAVIRRKQLTKKQLGVIVFFIASWGAWILIFRVYRYLIVLELLSGIIFFLGIASLLEYQKLPVKIVTLIVVTIFLYHITVYPFWGRRPWQDHFSNTDIVEIINQNKGADIVFYADEKESFLSPWLYGAHIPFRNLFSQPWWDGGRGVSPTDSVGFKLSPQSRVYFLQFSRVDPRTQSAYLNKLFTDDLAYDCKTIHANMLNDFLSLCTFKKL